MRIKAYFIIILLLCSRFAFLQDMDNPYYLDEEWSGYSIGDPYILKHRGVFYLYCSTKDNHSGIKTWSSKDLVHWDYEGLSSIDPVVVGAYAPEVFYWNGMFYMYTSPAGNGHYVLSSDSPLGPFYAVTSNLGKSIDGSIYIDDDGSWYFYHASGEGIKSCTMDDPLSFGYSINTGAWMNHGWTEGPCVFKRNGLYYMIYTGNHVISRGYRIDYAVSTDNPASGFVPAKKQNPILLDALGMHTGLGHGSIFIGPDLDSYYLCYHNLVSGIGPYRRLNIDRIAWNREKMLLLGPTDYAQQNPVMPDAYDYLERTDLGENWQTPVGGDWIMNNANSLIQDGTGLGDILSYAVFDSVAEANYTAEFNFKMLDKEDDQAQIGVIFSYTSHDSFGQALINSTTKELEIVFTQEGIPGEPVIVSLPQTLDISAWHTLRIEKFGSGMKFFIDAMHQLSLVHDAGGGKIGYASYHCKGEYSYLAFSNNVNGSGTFDVYKPVPGKIPAIQYNQGGEGIGYHKGSNWAEAPFQVRVDEVDLVEHELGGVALANLNNGDWFRYNVNVLAGDTYNVQFIYQTGQDDVQLKLYLDDQDISGSIILPATSGVWKTYLAKDITIEGGYHTIQVEVADGNLDLYNYEIVVADNDEFDIMNRFDGTFGSGWKYYDGDWSLEDGTAHLNGYGKRIYGSEGWRDYTVETDIKFTRSTNGGIVFRVNNPALGGAGDSEILGTDYLQGYFCGFNSSTVVLGKHNYGWEQLASASVPFQMNTWHHLRVVVNGDRIRIYFEDMDEPRIDYVDPYSFINGMAGFRSFNSEVNFDNFRVTSKLLTTSKDNKEKEIGNESILIYPNPSNGIANIIMENVGRKKLTIIDINGRKVLEDFTELDSYIIPPGRMSPGTYFVRCAYSDKVLTRKLIIL